MPSVPMLENPQVDTQALPAARTNTDQPIEAFGGGRQVQGIMDQTQVLAEKAQKEANEIAVQSASNRLTMTRNALLFDPQSGAMNKRGENAFNVVGEYGDQFDKAASDIEGGLSGYEQKAAFRATKLNQRAELTDALEKHTAAEVHTYSLNTIDNAIKLSKSDAITNYNNNDKINSNIQSISGQIDKLAQIQGMSPEQVAQEKAKAISDVHAGVVTTYNNMEKDQLAKAYFDEHKDQITGEAKEALIKELEIGSSRGEAQRNLKDIIAAHGNDVSGALEAARNVADPRAQDETVKKVQEYFTQKRLAQQQDGEDRTRRILDTLDSTKGRAEIVPSDIAGMTFRERNNIETYQKNLRAGVKPETDWGEFVNLREMAGNPETKEAFLEMDPMSFRNKMADSQFLELMNIREGLKKADTKTQARLDGFMTTRQIVDGNAKAAGMDLNSKAGTDQYLQLNDYRRRVESQIGQEQQESGKKLPRERVDQISNDLLKPIITAPGWLWDTTKKLYEVTPEDNFQIKNDQIPDGDRRQITKVLKASGKPVTESAIQDAYTKKLKGYVPSE